MRLSIAIQAHPRRNDLIADLAAALVGRVEVVYDPDPTGFPSPWRTYRHALERTPARATHRLVLQDDVQVCAGFLPAVRRAVRARPDRLLAFFHGGQPQENVWAIHRAAEQGEAWIRLDRHRWVPAVALCWPVRLIGPTLAFVDEQGWPPQFRADDEILGRAMRALNEPVLASVPSLVEHPDVVPSLIGRRAAGGADPGRVAACYIGGCDPASIDWTRGPS